MQIKTAAQRSQLGLAYRFLKSQSNPQVCRMICFWNNSKKNSILKPTTDIAPSLVWMAFYVAILTMVATCMRIVGGGGGIGQMGKLEVGRRKERLGAEGKEED